MKREKLFTGMLLLFSTLAGLILVEIILRYTVFATGSYLIQPPNLSQQFTPIPEVMPGVSGTARFSTSSIGLRAEELAGRSSFRVLAVGGSTTECLYLDDQEAWPALLQKKLSAAWNRSVWVGNAGISGRKLRDHILQIEELLKQVETVDMIILLSGVNDLLYRLEKGDQFKTIDWSDAKQVEQQRMRAFSIVPLPGLFTFRELAIGRLLYMVKFRFRTRDRRQDQAGSVFIKWRRMHQQAEVIHEQLPPMESLLNEYRMNLEMLITMTRQKNIRLLLLTQPSIWRSDLSPREQSLLWLGWGDDEKRSYYTVSAVRDGMELINDVTLATCSEQNVECIDLARLLPKSIAAFFDDVHFNEAGSASVARHVGSYLEKHPTGSASGGK